MKRGLFLFVLGVWAVVAMAQVNRWDEVAQLEQQSLPASALEVVKQIYAEAAARGDGPELFKSLIYQLKYETEIDREALPERIRAMEAVAEKEGDAVVQALFWSVLAELYTEYYRAHSHLIRERTEAEGDAPENLREWGYKAFKYKVGDLVMLSLAPAAELQKAKTGDYKDILVRESAEELCPTLLDFIFHQGIQTLERFGADEWYPEVMGLYVQWLIFRDAQTDRTEASRLALLMIELERAEYMLNHPQKEDAEDLYIQMLTDLEGRYAGQAISVEILYRAADYYYSKRYIDSEGQDERIEKTYDICMKGIKAYPDYKRIGLLENLVGEMTVSQIMVNGDNAVYPGGALKLEISYGNVARLTIDIYRIAAPVSVYGRWAKRGEYDEDERPVATHRVELPAIAPYVVGDTVVYIPMKELGCYEYVIHADTLGMKPANRQFSVTRLATIARGIDGKIEYVVVDRMSGKPVKGAEVRLYTDRNVPLPHALRTDANGLAVSDAKEAVFYNAVLQADSALALSPLPWVSPYREPQAATAQVRLFTDRSIYRPGQTVYFKGICYIAGDAVVADKSYTLTLRDGNGKEIASQWVRTNAFGSFAGDFLIPKGKMNGLFSIRTGDNMGGVSFHVEEYKRPTIDIQFKSDSAACRFGDTLTVAGSVKTFSGIQLQNTPVRYTVKRQYHWWFHSSYAAPTLIAEGTVDTQADGSFTLRFPVEKAAADRSKADIYYTYAVEATVTGSNGETQKAFANRYVGDKAMFLAVDGYIGEVFKDSTMPTVTIQANNLAGNPLPAQGTYEVHRLKATGAELFGGSLEAAGWELDTRMGTYSFIAGKEIDLNFLREMPSGRYRIVAKAADGDGHEVEVQEDFTLASYGDKRPPVPVYEWVATPKTICAVGEKAKIIYGSSAKNVYVLYELYKDNKKLSASRFILNNENRVIEIPFLESYGDGVTASFLFVKDGKWFEEVVPVYKKQEDKTLKLKLESFRDRLLPGQQEQWTLSVKDAAQHPAAAELLAGMYDASLDKLYRHDWLFSPVRPITLRKPTNMNGQEFTHSVCEAWKDWVRKEVPVVGYARFDLFGFSVYGNMLFTPPVIRSDGDPVRVGALRGVIASEAPDEKPRALAKESTLSDRAAGEAAAPPALRQNFSETAFFFPQLRINAAGETLLTFTLPESNTTWKFLGLAHTQDLRFGQITEQVISQKQLMVTPNIPRFLRAGDRAAILASVSNLSDQAFDGTATIELFDPATDQSVISVTGNAVHFALRPEQTVPVQWSFDVPDSLEIIGVRITAAAGNFSDGEQHLIPILPNRLLVTESLSLNVQGGQTRTFPLAPLFGKTSETMTDYRTTLELAGNPAWYAVQALPSLAAPKDDNVLAWFASYYVNTTAARIANGSPAIRQMISLWDKQVDSGENLLSPLEKNEELKSILLEETPWALEAENESAQRQRLATLFDANRLQYSTAQALEKLQALQTADGGWAWYPALPANISITQWILYGMASLRPDSTDAMTEKALHFIDNQFQKHYNTLKKNNPRWRETQTITTYELEYLFVRSLYPHIPSEEPAEATRFYTGLLAKHWAKLPSLYNRALAALVLHRSGQTPVAQAILRSLREHAVTRPDQGMYWPNNRTNSFMTQSAVCTHTFLMEAFHTIGSSPAELDNLKLWLLKQKQTQLWESVPATVNAIDMLLKTGSNWLESAGRLTASQGRLTAILGNQPLPPAPQDPGAAYLKTTQDPEAFKAARPASLTLANTASGPAWGALYRQYFEDLDQIAASETGLSISKSLIVPDGIGKSLIAPSDRPLQIGDKITVRLTVRTDRDLEFVHLKDLRAACLEPAAQLSGLQYQQGVTYYQSPKDASMNFFFPALPKGIRVFEYEVYVTAPGDYSAGIATIQCLYAPEFIGRTAGGRVRVE